MSDSLADLRIGDVLTFLAVQRAGSITGAARELKVTPSQVSKSMTRLESQLRLTLLARSSHKVSMTDAGLRVLPQLEDVVSRLRDVSGTDSERRQVTIGAPSYLCNFFVPRIAQHRPDIRVRSIELPPALIRGYASDNFFEIALTLGAQPFPTSWISAPVGEVKKRLFAAPSFAAKLGRPPFTPERVRELPFIAPIYHVGGQFVPADDDCPLPARERRIGHEVTTVVVALELATRCEQLVFAPAIAAEAYVHQKTLVEIPVRGWDVREELYLSCNADRVRAEDQKSMLHVIRTTLSKPSHAG